jgi:Nodulation protein S (NodS)
MTALLIAPSDWPADPRQDSAAAAHSQAFFESLFQRNDDPWQHRNSWYEARKRALLMAALPAARYGSVFEPGCFGGELTQALAARTRRLLACDGSARAVASRQI